MIYMRAVAILLQIVYKLVQIVSDEKLMKAGEQRLLAKQLADIAKASGTAKLLRAEVETMTDAEIDRQLEPDFRPD